MKLTISKIFNLNKEILFLNQKLIRNKGKVKKTEEKTDSAAAEIGKEGEVTAQPETKSNGNTNGHSNGLKKKVQAKKKNIKTNVSEKKKTRVIKDKKKYFKTKPSKKNKKK